MRILGSDGSREEQTHGCCGLEARTGPDGRRELYEYDAWHRRVKTIQKGIAGAPGAAGQDRAVEWTHDALGRTLSQTQTGGGLSLLVSTNAYDALGRVVWSRDAQGIETTTVHDDAQRRVTTTRAGLTSVSESHRDGRPHYTDLNGVRQQTHAYGVEPDGRQWTAVYTGPEGTNSPMWEKSWTDALGRTVRTERPGFGGSLLVSENFHDAQGRLVRSTRTGQPDTLYAYNDRGEQIRTVLDLNDNGVIDLAGPDRVTGSETAHVQLDGAWWQESASLVYPAAGDDTPKTVSVQRRRLTGLGVAGDDGLLAAEQVSLDLLGNATVSRTWIDRATATVMQTTHAPTAEEPAVQVSINGLQQTTQSPAGVVTAYTHDALGRPVSVLSESDNGARTVGQTTAYNTLGQVEAVEDAAGNKTWFAYDAAGRQSAVTNALGQVTHTAYDPQGRVVATWGATYPVAYEYDHHGRMTAMATTRDPAHESVNLWTLVPAGTTLTAYSLQSTALDLTQWQHDLATGLVTNKVYANGKGTSYMYTPDGKLARRTWARGVTTDYGYTIAGELASVDYSDATPDVAYTHDRLGRPVTMTDALGVSTNVYDASTLVLTEERWPGGVALVRTTDAYGRPSGLALGQDYAVTYGYDTAGRFGTVTANVNATTNVVTCGYIQGSDLMAGWSSNVGMSFQRTFEPNRDLIGSVTNAWNATPISSFAYTNDEIGRRTARVDSGLTQNSFGYNMRSEVVNAIMGTNTYGYEYDPIGNRLTATNNTATLSYTANELNQYLEISNGQTIEPTYDDDGNMTTYGDWTLVWNGENRLTQISNFQFQISYTYDHQGRMVEKTVNAATMRYLWDGFNIVAEIGANETRYNIWGLDLSQTQQGAGGVGGLLAVAVAGGADPGIFYPAYDANGNITEYVDTTGDVVATRAYSPFGETTAATGNADAFTHWWSTKPWDPVTGFSEYEFRMYHPGLGRWVNRDPLEEVGGLNIYLLAFNEPIANYDMLGLFDLPNTWITRLHNRARLWFIIPDATLRAIAVMAAAQIQVWQGDDPWIMRFLDNYLFGVGEKITLSKEEVRQLRTEPIIVDFHREFLGFRNPRTIGERRSTQIYATQGHSAGNLTLHQFYIRYKGTIEDCSFKGQFQIEDRFDFNWRDWGERGVRGEFRLRVLTLLTSGIPFDIDSEWIWVEQRLGEPATW